MKLTVTSGAKYAAILGLGGYRPRRVVDNAEICTMIDSSDEWIRTRSGIIERRWASEDETIQMMSVAAARKALDRAGIEPGQVDTVIVSTVTHLYQTPAVATTIGLRWVLLRNRDGRLLHSQWRLEVCLDHRRGAAHRHDQSIGPIHGLSLR